MISSFIEGIPWALLVISAFLVIRLHGVVKNLSTAVLRLNEETQRLESNLSDFMREVERSRNR